MTDYEKHIKNGFTHDEALALIEADKAIDKGEKMEFDLTKDQKKNVKKFTSTGSKKASSTVRSRKIDEEKLSIITKIAEIFGENAQIVKNEREISLKIGENDYTITLTKHRKK